ncbi:MAG TPA: hypothetical protein IGR64_05875 [Leptolyngbyaceae cyanobacterium M65_K2018_010]|nr:hypothetical protein [Leptolyngbyaceae cyanobacterium M65_K2018_010]
MATLLKRPDSKHFYSSSVMEYIVPESRVEAFQDWYGQVRQVVQQYPGFLRADLCSPLNCNDGVVKFYSIIHFSTPKFLNNWLKSKQRQHLFTAGQAIFLAYRFKSFSTGLEGWFSSQAGPEEQGSLGPAPWKQVLAVVLGLYPTLMVQGMVFAALGIMQSWPMPTALLINNLITSSLLTWVVMPRISRLFSFWLQPAYFLTSRQANLLGTIVVLSILGGLVILFNLLQKLNA